MKIMSATISAKGALHGSPGQRPGNNENKNKALKGRAKHWHGYIAPSGLEIYDHPKPRALPWAAMERAIGAHWTRDAEQGMLQLNKVELMQRSKKSQKSMPHANPPPRAHRRPWTFNMKTVFCDFLWLKNPNHYPHTKARRRKGMNYNGTLPELRAFVPLCEIKIRTNEFNH